MTLLEQIENALASHKAWKRLLEEMIEQEADIVQIESIQSDHHCAFGKWLYKIGSEMSGAEYAAMYADIRKLHAEFHIAAAGVAKLALAGKKAEAEKLMAPDGNYFTASKNLMDKMTEWETAIQK